MRYDDESVRAVLGGLWLYGAERAVQGERKLGDEPVRAVSGRRKLLGNSGDSGVRSGNQQVRGLYGGEHDGVRRSRFPFDQPGCDQNKCVECTASAQCGTSKPLCDTVTSNRCTECLVNMDCTSMSTPKCLVDNTDVTKNACVGCLMNADCMNPTPICEMTTTHKCVACLADVDCGAGSTASRTPTRC